jgi:hypothetical protein
MITGISNVAHAHVKTAPQAPAASRITRLVLAILVAAATTMACDCPMPTVRCGDPCKTPISVQPSGDFCKYVLGCSTPTRNGAYVYSETAWDIPCAHVMHADWWHCPS